MSAAMALSHRMARYLRLRPPLLWSLVSFVLLFGMLFVRPSRWWSCGFRAWRRRRT